MSTGRQEIKVNIYLRISQMYIEKINKLDILELLLSPPNISSLSNLLILKDENNERPIFLAHLSRRLMGELIVYQSLRRPSVGPSVRQHFQTSSPL